MPRAASVICSQGLMVIDEKLVDLVSEQAKG